MNASFFALSVDPRCANAAEARRALRAFVLSLPAPPCRSLNHYAERESAEEQLAQMAHPDGIYVAETMPL